MSDIWKSVSYLVRCDEGSVRLATQLRDWIEETNRVFLSIAHGLPHLQREIDEGRRALSEMHARISDETMYRGGDSPRHQIVRTFLALIEAQKKDQTDLAEFAAYFNVVEQVRSALGSLADLMEDVECFSVNAIVQAHNAGDRGRGFSQVSREVVALTKRAAAEFERVRGLSRHIEQNLDELKSAVAHTQEHFDKAPIRVGPDIDGVFMELDISRTEVLNQVEKLTASVAESSSRVNRMLVGLQFDDRCTQISHHLSESLARLHEEISNLTNQDNTLDLAASDTTHVMDTVCLSLGVFDMVAKLVESLEEDLVYTRTEMSTFLEELSVDLSRKSENAIQVDELTQVIHKTRSNLEEFLGYMREQVRAKGEIVTRAEALAGQVVDLRDDLEGVRRTAKRFGVMASIIKVELASAGLDQDFGEALSADRVENLYRDMASAVGSVLISLDATVKQVQRRSTVFRQGLAHEEDTLRQAEGLTHRLVKELEGTLVHYLYRGGASFRSTLGKLHKEATGLRLEVSNIVNLGRQSGRIKGDARGRVLHLSEDKNTLLERMGETRWEIRDDHVRHMVEACTVQTQRDMVSHSLGGGTQEKGDQSGELTLF
ncbi:MAG: hypothetical protein OEW11_00930 [Nitrospirota bacterium]|nr:hypothetical protein [Nitrospirota bacterium]